MRLLVAGTRPEIIKLAPIIKEFETRGLDYMTFNTQQHYDDNMSEQFYRELELKQPVIWSKEWDFGKLVTELETLMTVTKFKYAVVVGDTWSVLAGVIAGLRTGTKIAHVEAGLRSKDNRMTEEHIRMIADHASDYLFAPTDDAKANLKAENIEEAKSFMVGNTIADAVKIYGNANLNGGNYILLTMHRPETVDNKDMLLSVLRGVRKVQEALKLDVIFPIHPRTRLKIEQFGISMYDEIPQLRALDPVSFRFMLYLESSAKLILTDSGGVQEEACILGVPCVTFRISTERPETVLVGANAISGTDSDSILKWSLDMVERKGDWKSPYGEGDTAKKIVDILEK